MALDRLVAVVLAGGAKRFSLREFYHQLEDFFFYREWYFRKGYKALKRVKLKRGRYLRAKPMVEYILNTLIQIDDIKEILVVGPKEEMEQKLDPALLTKDSHIRLVQQKDSFGQNVKEGYNQAGEKHVLFVTADSPTTRKEDVIEFINTCRALHDDYRFIYPLVKEALLKKYQKFFPRPYFKMIPDNIYPPGYIRQSDYRHDGRVGFRITSMAFGNLENFPVERLDESYDLRKLVRKSNRDKLKEIFGKNLIRRYRKGLRMSEIEKMFADYEKVSIKLVGISGVGTSLDIDSTRDEEQFSHL
jgi:CTP:molybdopterin cytidylyltransferase MocA